MKVPARTNKIRWLGESAGWRVFAVLLALLTAACTTEDRKEYDIPARQVIRQASLEIEPDGTPIVLAQVGMNYSSAAPPSQLEPRFQERNIQCIAYTPGAGGWVSHSFRNLQANVGASYLLRNSKGETQALVESFHRLILYSHKGADWEAKKSIPIETGDPERYGMDVYNPNQLALVGDSAWDVPDQSAVGIPPRSQLAIKRNNRTLTVLDSVSNLFGSLMLPGNEFNYLIIPYQTQSVASAPSQKIICYRWSLDPANPNPRKQVLTLAHVTFYETFFSAQVLGETRVYFRLGQDSLAEFGLRNDTLSFLGYRGSLPGYQFAPTSRDSSGSPQYMQYLGGSLGVDPRGCIHSFDILVKSSTSTSDFSPVMVHASSCEAAGDTVSLPHPTPGGFDPFNFNIGFAPDGSPMLTLVWVKSIKPDYFPQSLPPSWLYLARRGAGKKWTWEKIAEY